MIPRKTIAELKTRYRLEPELADVYVEGMFDKQLLDEVFSLRGENDRVVYNIDTIKISPDLLEANGLSDGNKQRVIYLARSTSSLSDNCKFRCLVDKDLDDFYGDLEKTKRLSWTKFATIELCFFNLKSLEKILITFANCSKLDLNSLLPSLNVALKSLFALRLVDRDMDLNCEWPCPKKQFSIKSNEVLFDETSYVNRLLSRNSIHKKRKEFIGRYKSRFEQIEGLGMQDAIRGHDLTKLLAWVISKSSSVKDIGEDDIIERFYISMPKLDEVGDILFGLSI